MTRVAWPLALCLHYLFRLWPGWRVFEPGTPPPPPVAEVTMPIFGVLILYIHTWRPVHVLYRHTSSRYPANTTHWTDVGSMLDRRRRRRANIKTTLVVQWWHNFKKCDLNRWPLYRLIDHLYVSVPVFDWVVLVQHHWEVQHFLYSSGLTPKLVQLSASPSCTH